MTSQIQNGYRRQLEDLAAEQEARYGTGVDRDVTSAAAANNPTAAPTTAVARGREWWMCSQSSSIRTTMTIERNRIMTDAYPPDGRFGGTDGRLHAGQRGRDHFPRQRDTNTIVFLDNNTGGAVSTTNGYRDRGPDSSCFATRTRGVARLDGNVADQPNVVLHRDPDHDPHAHDRRERRAQPETRTLSSGSQESRSRA